MLKEILKAFTKRNCQHKNVTIKNDISYCPDCGKLIRINWYVIRCKCCNKKRMGVCVNGVIKPVANFCSNCGENDYIIEKITKLNYFDVNFALYTKEEEENQEIYPEMQVWVDKDNQIQKLIPKFSI